MHFISSQILFYLSIGLILFVPGYFLIFATRLNKQLNTFESFVISFGISIIVIDFLTMLLGKSPFHITRNSIIIVLLLFYAICYGIYFYHHKKNPSSSAIDNIPQKELSKNSAVLIILIIFLTIFIKTIYFQNTIFPTATDLGHHMYWAKIITTNGNLPRYEKVNIGSDFTIQKPEPIADFIIGEHLIFSVIALASGSDFISTFPSLILFLVHIMSILTLFILTLLFFRNIPYGESVALLVLFLIGPLYALASPQAKFVSGGVIGNTIGNLFIPLAIFFYIRAFTEKKASMLAWAFFVSFGLAYTHHLSTFVFIFIILFSLLIFAAINFKQLFREMHEWLKIFIRFAPLAVLISGIIFIIFVYTPTYLNSSAIDTAVGTPSKESRAGLTLHQLKMTAGEARFVFAILGLAALFLLRKAEKYKQAFLFGWIGSLIAMSLFPNWLFIDIPSNRIASYVVFPASIFAAYLFVRFFVFLRNNHNYNKNFLGSTFILIIFVIFALFIATDGLRDNSKTLTNNTSIGKSLQAYAASEYLSSFVTSQDMILKDHVYLSGDTWIKLFFMQDYNYPLSHVNLKRYTDAPNREQCTNLMISMPSSREAKNCFAGTKTNFIMINPSKDGAQFNRLKNFWQVYVSDDTGIFYRNL